MRFDDQRKRLVDELRLNGITDERVLYAFGKVPREHFVISAYRDYAYRNQPLPIDAEQTISQPLMIAIMLQHLELTPDDVVLEIGTGSGYQTALLSLLVKEVCTIERIEELSLKARTVLKENGYNNIYYRIGDGGLGWIKAFPPHKTFPKIIVSAAAAELPQKLISQLADPGICVVPVGKAHIQTLIKIRHLNGKLIQTEEGGCTFVPLVRDGE